MEITSKQRAFLKKTAHGYKPSVMIGGKGVSDQVINTINEELEIKELIKIKFIDFKETKKELFPQIAEKTGAVAVALLGNTGLLYKENPDEEKRKVQLP